MPFVRVQLGSSQFLVNLDTGASDWMAVPPALQDRIRWMAAPRPGPVVSNNQTGDTRVLLGQSAGLLTFGALQVPLPCIYANPDADTPWLGSGAMRWAAWTFHPMTQRVEVSVPAGGSVGDSPCDAD